MLNGNLGVWIEDQFLDLENTNSVKLEKGKVTVHIPINVVFHGSDSKEDLEKAVKWAEKELQKTFPGSKIRNPLTKRQRRRERGRRRNYLN